MIRRDRYNDIWQKAVRKSTKLNPRARDRRPGLPDSYRGGCVFYEGFGWPKEEKMRMARFPETIEAAKAAVKSQWRIGEALIDESDGAMVGSKGLNAVVQELNENGIEDFSASYLSELRTAAEAFPRNRRHDLPWSVHSDAGNPDTLDAIVRAAKKESEKVTKWYVRDALRRMRAAAREERQEAAEAARREAEKAEAEEEAARKREQQAKDKTERENHKRDREAARARKREAREKQKKAKAAPKRRDVPPPPEEDVSTLAACAFVTKNAAEVKRLADKSEKRLNKHFDDLSPAAIAGLTDAAMNAANAWADLATRIQRATSTKRGHLRVVNE